VGQGGPAGRAAASAPHAAGEDAGGCHERSLLPRGDMSAALDTPQLCWYQPIVPIGVARVMKSMLQMCKIDLDALNRAQAVW